LRPEEKLLNKLENEKKERAKKQKILKLDNGDTIQMDRLLDTDVEKAKREKFQKLCEMSTGQQRVHFLNECFTEWSAYKDSIIWDVMIFFLCEEKTRKRARSQRALKIDPMKGKLDDAKDFLGHMGILSRGALINFGRMMKTDLRDLADLMQYKMARDDFLLMGDTASEAARALNELRPEFTIDPPEKRRRRPPYPDAPKDFDNLRTLNVVRSKYEVYKSTEAYATGNLSLVLDDANIEYRTTRDKKKKPATNMKHFQVLKQTRTSFS